MRKYKMTNPALFRRDESGQWWYRDKRTEPAKCPECGEWFIKTHKTTSTHCGRRCAYVAKWRDIPPENRRRRWFGGRNRRGGYIDIYCPDHPSLKGTKRKYVLEHRLVMERILGRFLLPTEHVHHKNGIKADNRPENLELWTRHHPNGSRSDEAAHCPTCTCHLKGGEA